MTQVSALPSPGLMIVVGPASGTRIAVTSEPFVFGRSEDELGSLGGDPELSRRHASVSFLDPDHLLVEDLSSTNGTFVNDHRITAPTVVRPGDSLRIGATTLQIVGAGRNGTAGTKRDAVRALSSLLVVLVLAGCGSRR